ncbi:MAG: patatin-like phospholipase family protein [Bacteroidales bacterium]|nr:patatin-like phospholipase family protein [Bacteroidales bacterium]
MGKQVSLVLSGGGARGIAHIGAIEELERSGYEIVSIAGTSMGALVGGVYALNKLDELKQWLLTLDRFRVFALIDFTFSSHGLIKGDKVLSRMKEFIPDEKIEDLPIPYRAIAVNLINKEEIVFDQGSIFDAIRASISIPSVITPVKMKNSLLVDGGVLNNIPIQHVKRFKNDILIAVNVNANTPLVKLPGTKKELKEKNNAYQEKIASFREHLSKILPAKHEHKLGYFELITKTITTMTYQIDHLILEKHPPDILINISRESCGTFDFFKAEELIEIGRISTRKTLESTK